MVGFEFIMPRVKDQQETKNKTTGFKTKMINLKTKIAVLVLRTTLSSGDHNVGTTRDHLAKQN